MPTTVVDEESSKVLKEFFKVYQEELERESNQRDKQAVVDSKQDEILAKKAIEDEKQAELDAEQLASDKQELADFRKNIADSLDKLKSAESPTKEDYQKLNSNIEKLIEVNEQSKAVQTENSQVLWLIPVGIVMIIGFALLGYFAKFMYKLVVNFFRY